MRKGIVSGILCILCLSGCAPTRQGTRGQLENACSLPVRAFQSIDRAPLAVPAAGDALCDPAGLRCVPAAIEGAGRQAQSALRGTGEF